MDEFQSGLMFLGVLATLLDVLLFPFSLIMAVLTRILFHPSATV